MTNSLGGRGRLGADLPVRMSAVRLENPRVPGIDRPIGHVACGRARQLAAQGAALILRTAQLGNVTRAWWWPGLVRTPVSVVSGGTCQEAPTEHMARAKWPNWYFDLQFLGRGSQQHLSAPPTAISRERAPSAPQLSPPSPEGWLKSQTKSQRSPTPGDARRRPSTISAGKRLVRRHRAT